jgi:Holliday junction DNA helicase RuvB
VEVAKDSLNRLGIDKEGLDDMDRRILIALVEKFNGGPVGLESLGVAISEDARTIEEVYEPYLIKEGFVQRTSRGRKALSKTFTYLGVEKPNDSNQSNLF